MKKILLNFSVIVGCTLASTASAVNHDQTFPAMLEMVTSATPEELAAIKENFCLGQFAAVMTASDIRGRAAELATDDFTSQVSPRLPELPYSLVSFACGPQTFH